jgi:glycosyltransferase involved in cell wall biosynthesis
MTVEAAPLRVLYAVHAYKPAYRVGGPVISVSAAAESLVSRGHKVTVFTTNANLDEDLDVPVNQPIMVDGVEVWYFKRREPLQLLFPFFSYLSKSIGYLYTPALAKALKQLINEFDLVHTHMPYVYPTLATGRVAIKADKPLFYHQRGVFDPERLKFRKVKKSLYIAAVERPIMRKATTLIALTEKERENYRKLKVNTPCRIIPNAIDTATYLQVPSDYLSSFFPFGQDHIVLLFLGRLHPIKGADLLLESFSAIGSQFPKAVLVMAGPDEYGLQSQFKRHVKNAGLANRVLFPGMVTGRLKIDLLARADLFCLPSVAEGFSMAILEAMASATPVLISPRCHFPEVENYGAGWVVDRVVEQWTKSLAKILSRSHQLSSMGEKALGYVKSTFSWEKVTTLLEEVYWEGVQRHRNAANKHMGL